MPYTSLKDSGLIDFSQVQIDVDSCAYMILSLFYDMYQVKEMKKKLRQVVRHHRYNQDFDLF